MQKDFNRPWEEKVQEMDRLCQLHLEVPYTTTRVQGHLILAKMFPEEKELPLKKGTLYMEESDKISQFFIGIVVAYGKYAFKDGVATKWTEGPLCDLGDYVAIPNYEVTRTMVNTYPVMTFRDVNTFITSDDPLRLGRITVGRFPKLKKRFPFTRKQLEETGFNLSDYGTSNIEFLEDYENEV